MKKIAVLLLCFSMLTAGSITAYADTPNTAPGKATIGTVVPDTHHIKLIVKGRAVVTLNGETGTDFTVERLSTPELIVIPNPRDMNLIKVTMNGEDVTDIAKNGTFKLSPVYEDKVIEIVVNTDIDSPFPAGPTGSGGSGGSGESGESGGSDDGGEAAPTDGGEAAPTDGGEAAPADGGETAPADSSEAPAGDDSGNPATGIAGGVSIGSAALLALGLFRRKHSEKD